MTRRIALLLAALAIAPLRVAAQSATGDSAPARGAPVSAIRVEGNRRVEPDAIRNALKTKVGMAFDPLRAQTDLESLWRLGFFSDAQILLDDSDPAKPVLVVRVTEKPAVRAVKVEGNKELSDEDLKGAIDVKPFSILDRGAVRRNAKKLQEKYVEKGYFLAEVTSDIQATDRNEVVVVFKVNEHAKVQIKRITFVGNRKVPDSELKAAMQTEEGGLLSFITGSGTFRDDVFQRDLAALQGVYYDQGFIHARVGQPQVALSPDRRLMFLTIPLTEGEQYTVGRVDFSGDLLRSKAELRERMTVSPGELFNRSKLQRDIMSLTEIYYDEGYAYANISPQNTIDPEKKTIDLTFDVQKGEKVYIEAIEIAGNTRTRDKVIRRELRIYEGELFSGSGLRLSQQRVTALGFFETVDVNYKRGSADDTVVVSVTVKEKPTGTFQVGLGFSSVENFLLTAQVSQNNAFGWGQTASLAAQISSLRNLIQLSYYDPYFLDTKWILSFTYSRQELDYFGFIRRSNGGDLTWGYHLTPDLKLHLGYGIENVNVEAGTTGSLGSDVLLANRFRNGWTSSLRLTLEYDKRDNRLFPTKGLYQSASVEYSPEWLGATFVFQRYLVNSRFYYPLPFGLVAKAQGTLGLINGVDLPISELFFLGGITSVRGYQLRTISPTTTVGSSRSPDATLYDFNTGGNKEAYFNFELEFPVVEKAGIRGVLFYDMGNVYSESEGLFSPKNNTLPLGMLHSFGIGFRWFSPIGPLRFEWGFPLNRRPEIDEPYLFEFTIGNSF